MAKNLSEYKPEAVLFVLTSHSRENNLPKTSLSSKKSRRIDLSFNLFGELTQTESVAGFLSEYNQLSFSLQTLARTPELRINTYPHNSHFEVSSISCDSDIPELVSFFSQSVTVRMKTDSQYSIVFTANNVRNNRPDELLLIASLTKLPQGLDLS